VSNGSGAAETIAENVWVRLIGRGSMIFGAVAIALIGYFAKATLDDIKETAGETLAQLRDLSKQQTAAEVAAAHLETRVDGLDQRVGVVEQRLDAWRFTGAPMRP
jgi:hypothetical protein